MISLYAYTDVYLAGAVDIYNNLTSLHEIDEIGELDYLLD